MKKVYCISYQGIAFDLSILIEGIMEFINHFLILHAQKLHKTEIGKKERNVPTEESKPLKAPFQK